MVIQRFNAHTDINPSDLVGEFISSVRISVGCCRMSAEAVKDGTGRK